MVEYSEWAFFKKTVAMSLAIPTSHDFLTADEQSLDLFPMSSDLTVSQAAAILDMSEACIYDLIKLDVLKYRQEGTECWIDRDWLLEHKQHRDRWRAGVKEMIRLDQEMGLTFMEFNLEEFNATRKAIREADRRA